MNEDRFVRTYSQAKDNNIFEIWVDKATGVNYAFHTNGNVGGLTVMYDANGQVLTTNPWIHSN